MAFLNLELYFRDLFAAALEEARNDGSITDDLFSDRPEEERFAIQQYFSERRVETDMRVETDGERVVYVIPSFPVSNLPFPQIGIYLGGEDSQDFFLGQEAGGEPKPITQNGQVVAWDYQKGYYAGINYRTDIIANSKEEVIWLSRLCQRAIAVNILKLEEMGVVEVRIAAGDTKLEQEHYPALVFSRAVIFTGKSLHTWSNRVPAYGYEIGVNTALEV